MKTIVAYYRVSTQKQGKSGLGLEGQEACIREYCAANNAEVIKAFKEIESGKVKERPELLKAIAFAKRARATLVVAKLDRLARNVVLIATLMESKVDFVACDCPHANSLTIHILAALAEYEAKLISERTRAALRAYKARGGKLGSHRHERFTLTPEAIATGSARGAATNKQLAIEAYADLLPSLQAMRSEGQTLQAIANHLNAEGHTTRTGKPFSHVQVKFCLDRAEGKR